MLKAIALLRANVVRKGDCLLYQGKGDGKGYGRITWKQDGRVRTIAAHRLAYELEHGPIPAGLLIRHTCHNPRCAAVAHLKTGTPAENSADMVKAGRSLRRFGEKNPNAKLTDAQRAAIIADRMKGRTLKSLAKQYGVHLSTIGYVCKKP